MQMRSRGTARLANEGYYLTGFDVLTFLDQILRVMGVIGLKTVRVSDSYEIAIAGELVRVDHFSSKSCIDLIFILCLQVGTSMHPSATLTEGTDHFGTRQWEVPVASIGYFTRIIAMGTSGEQYAQKQ